MAGSAAAGARDAALAAADGLRKVGISAAVINPRFIKPLDAELICTWARRCGRVITIEDNVRQGGFGQAVRLIRPVFGQGQAGFATQAYRSSDSAVFVCVEGRGELRVGDRRLALRPRDVAVVPGWMAYRLHAESDLVLFSYSDRVAQEKLGFWREQRL